MAITPSDIARVANLARLELPAEQSEPLADTLNGFFKLVEQMQAVDTTGVEPHDPSTSALRLRDDVVSESNQRAANQASAPAVERGLFLVPKVIE